MAMKVKLIRAAVIAAFVPAFVAGCSSSTASPATQAATTAAVTQAPAGAGFRVPDFSQLAEQAGPAVVNISVTKPVSSAAAELLPFDENDPLFGFFRHFQLPVPKQAPMRGVGSGFIVSPDGYVLTNAHVVDGAKEVDVKLTDRRQFTAKVVGTDPKSDVALLKIEAKDLPVVRIGHSQDIKVGQWVVAMGSPFGFENSVTAGIISAKSRSLPGEGYVPFIQTDVAVNPGNSGGPLFDLNGNVIGINSQIYSQTGGYMGLSFAIPIDVAMHVKDQLQKYGKVTRGRIGVAIQPVNQSLAQSFGLAKPEGALVSLVDDEGPAARAGIKAGDVILAWNGKAVDESATLPALVADTAPGQTAQVRLWRDAKELTVGVTVGSMPNEKVASSENPAANSGKLGLVVRPLTAEERSQLHARAGLFVEDAGGAGAAAGLQPGDVILALNNQPVRSVEQLRRLLDKAGKHVALLVQRDAARMYVPIDLG
jgi:serine protease Do